LCYWVAVAWGWCSGRGDKGRSTPIENTIRHTLYSRARARPSGHQQKRRQWVYKQIGHAAPLCVCIYLSKSEILFFCTFCIIYANKDVIRRRVVIVVRFGCLRAAHRQLYTCYIVATYNNRYYVHTAADLPGIYNFGVGWQ